MRVSREKAAENRQRIVEIAARLFRESGFDGVGVDAIMSGAGLTHGGFYGHFGSKDALAFEAVVRALEQGAEVQSRRTNLNDLVSGYLSERHLHDPSNGCVLAALGGDLARQGTDVRGAVAAYLRTQLDRIAQFFEGTKAGRRKEAIATLAGMVGALTLARAVDDSALSKEILDATREALARRRRGC